MFLSDCRYRGISAIIPVSVISIVIICITSAENLSILNSALVGVNGLANATPADTTAENYANNHATDDVANNFSEFFQRFQTLFTFTLLTCWIIFNYWFIFCTQFQINHLFHKWLLHWYYRQELMVPFELLKGSRTAKNSMRKKLKWL